MYDHNIYFITASKIYTKHIFGVDIAPALMEFTFLNMNVQTQKNKQKTHRK